MAIQPGLRRRSIAYRSAPPLTHSDAEPEGAEIIREVPGAAGILLAGGLRDLMLWIETPAAARCGLFLPDASAERARRIRLADLEQPLWTPVLTFGLLAEDGSSVDAPRLLDACRGLARWADLRGSPGTRLAFVQAAALLRPHDATLAIEVAKLARDLGQHARAESWFRHAVRLTRNTDWESYVWSYVGLGVLYIRTGNLPAANVVMLRALRTATRHRLLALAGVAHHHLFHLTTEAGRIREAYEHVRAALECYGPDHPQLNALVADVGRYWLSVGHGKTAAPILEAVLDTLEDSNDRAVVSANSTWAAACGGDAGTYRQRRERTLALIGCAASPRQVDDAYLSVSYADLAMEEWEAALESADEALRAAALNGSAEVRLRAESVRESAREGGMRRTAPVAHEGRHASHAHRLASELLTALAAA